MMNEATVTDFRLTSMEWINIAWVISRITSLIDGHPPETMSVQNGLPMIAWGDPEDDFSVIVLDFYEGKFCLHASPRLPETIMLSLVGICTLRQVSFDLMNDDDEPHATH